jgi:hypothetical protein
MEVRDEVSCPACGEKILSIAKKCKHCGEWISHSIPIVDDPSRDAHDYGMDQSNFWKCKICGETHSIDFEDCWRCSSSSQNERPVPSKSMFENERKVSSQIFSVLSGLVILFVLQIKFCSGEDPVSSRTTEIAKVLPNVTCKTRPQSTATCTVRDISYDEESKFISFNLHIVGSIADDYYGKTGNSGYFGDTYIPFLAVCNAYALGDAEVGKNFGVPMFFSRMPFGTEVNQIQSISMITSVKPEIVACITPL